MGAAAGHAPLRTNYRAPTTLDAHAIKRRAFHDQDVLVVDLNDPRVDWAIRELLRQAGERIYGKRAHT